MGVRADGTGVNGHIPERATGRAVRVSSVQRLVGPEPVMGLAVRLLVEEMNTVDALLALSGLVGPEAPVMVERVPIGRRPAASLWRTACPALTR